MGVSIDAMDIVIRGRVRPGLRVRVGGIEAQPDAEGHFAVPYRLREGETRVRIEASGPGRLVRRDVAVRWLRPAEPDGDE